MKHYRLYLTPVTPIHIGTGEELLPFNYIIKNIASKSQTADFRLIRFNDFDLIKKLNTEDKEILKSLAKKDDLLKLREFFIQKADTLVIKNQELILSMSEVTTEVLNLWEDMKAHPKNLFAIRPALVSAIRGNKYFPYIPGSSLKGAVRTAILDAGPAEFKKKKNYSLGKDPFRTLAFSDARLPAKGSRLVGAVYLYNRHKSEVESLQMMYEVVKGTCVSEQAPECVSELTSNIELQRSTTFEWEIPDIHGIASRCNTFYSDLLEQEYDDFYANAPEDVFQGFNFVDKVMDRVKKANNEFMIRLGRHSQFEFMTLNGIRECKNPKYNKSSRTLFKYKNVYYPMGWMHVRYEVEP